MVGATPPRKENTMRRFALFTFVLVCLALAAPALASHPPSERSRAQLNAAVRHSELMPSPIRDGRFRLREARVSSRGPWAKATIVPRGKLKRRLDPLLAIFRREGRRWRLVTAGTAAVGCEGPRLPGPVRRDLDLACPPVRPA
jgi:hypothetical protein